MQESRSLTILQRAVKEAIRKGGVVKHAGCHTFRHSFATLLLEAGYDIRAIQELLIHIETVCFCRFIQTV